MAKNVHLNSYSLSDIACFPVNMYVSRLDAASGGRSDMTRTPPGCFLGEVFREWEEIPGQT